jgi:hypothetical protein
MSDDPLPPQPDGWEVFPARVAPAVLSLAAIVAGVLWSWWWLIAIPCIWLGSICAQPNLNLADRCLAYLTAGAGIVIVCFHPRLGEAILAGVLAGYVTGFFEKNLTMKPWRRSPRQSTTRDREPRTP